MKPKRMIAKTHQGSGKGIFTDSLAEQIVKSGGTVVIAVATFVVAVERVARLAHLNPLLLASHEKHFLGRTDQCPQYSEIQKEVQVRQTSKQIRIAYCNACPSNPACPYFGQYQKILDEERKLIIMQHAHLTLPEVQENLERRGVSLLVVDEDVFEALRQVIKIEPWQIEAMKEITAATTNRRLSKLSEWIEFGGTPDLNLKINVQDRRQIFEHLGGREGSGRFEKMMALIDAYNTGHSIASGEVSILVKSLPRALVQMFTDATCDPELLKLLLDDPAIQVIEGGVFNPAKVHPGNEVIQVLDFSTSISNLQGTKEDGEFLMEYFAECLFYIGETVRARDLQKPLVTTYKKWIDDVRTFLENNFRDVFDRFEFGHMEAGTNKFDDCDAQFLLCGRHLSKEQLQAEMFELKSIAHFWDSVKDRPIRYGHFCDVLGLADVDSISGAALKNRQGFVPVKRIEMIDRFHAREFEYPKLKIVPEVDHPLAQMAYRRADAKTQQAIRIRFTEDRPKLLVVFGNRLLPGFVVSQSILFADLVLANRPGSGSR